MANKVIVCCKLPYSLILEHPVDKKKTITINGKNKALIIGAEYAMTEVDNDFWDAWLQTNKNYSVLTSGAIFVAKDNKDAASIGKEYKERKSGFEQMPQSYGQIRPSEAA